MRLIDGDAFDKKLSDAQAECKRNGWNFRFGVLANVRGNLSKVPSVDAVPVVHGRWETDSTEQNVFWGHYCNRCSTYLPYGRDWRPNYCPECGAKMDLEG